MYGNVTESLVYIRTALSSSLFVAHFYHPIVFVRCGEDFLSLSLAPQFFIAYYFSLAVLAEILTPPILTRWRRTVLGYYRPLG